ncbi:hypothetical protein BT96DRAFT_990210 [Gymnopus androsaceus JB14]|uniref:Glycosyltransferase 61 catalytic domain-containing protein n=1 Tax=Gymnopus androsaceus JB14 TaxID=1447944 RepID=A0A6A4HYD1_9AGAR|nr:hypothetical protein BT96DRAFT_990210 [Gymnopus androsaceus JB14]
MFRSRRYQAIPLVFFAGFVFLVTFYPYPLARTTFLLASSLQSECYSPIPIASEHNNANANAALSYKSTTIPDGAHANGFTIFDNLYLRNGTLFVVTANVEAFPAKEAILSAPLDMAAGRENLPTNEHMQFIDPREAKGLLGSQPPLYIDDLTVIVYDTDQFVGHYYHWWGELVLGFWRVYSMLGESDLAFPTRFMLPFIDQGRWRDDAGVNGPLLRAIHPSLSVETLDQWKDFIKLDRTVVFNRVAIINRQAGHRHPLARKYSKMIAPTMELEPSSNFWAPLQKALARNLLGYGPFSEMSSKNLKGKNLKSKPKPIVTYVSRQTAKQRRLMPKDHQDLVRGLLQLEKEGLCQVLIPEMERMPIKEQVEIASRSTIMVGVHGNGLTHQLWMPSSPQSAVIEIFIPQGYLFDYEILSRNMGHQHYAIWNDTVVTYPIGTTHKGTNKPPGFQGNNIPVHGPTVIDVIRQRLSAKGAGDNNSRMMKHKWVQAGA